LTIGDAQRNAEARISNVKTMNQLEYTSFSKHSFTLFRVIRGLEKILSLKSVEIPKGVINVR